MSKWFWAKVFPLGEYPPIKKTVELYIAHYVLAAESLILFTKTIYEIKEGGGGCSPLGHSLIITSPVTVMSFETNPVVLRIESPYSLHNMFYVHAKQSFNSFCCNETSLIKGIQQWLFSPFIPTCRKIINSNMAEWRRVWKGGWKDTITRRDNIIKLKCFFRALLVAFCLSRATV